MNDEQMKFPFDDFPNTAVITCTHILDGKEPLLYVSHDKDDGMWQFLCGRCHNENEGRIVSLQYIYMKDNSVEELAKMPCGCYAERESQKSAWRIVCAEIKKP